MKKINFIFLFFFALGVFSGCAVKTQPASSENEAVKEQPTSIDHKPIAKPETSLLPLSRPYLKGVNLLLVDDKTQQWEEISLYKKTYALIIGIDKYPLLGPEHQLSYAVSDAKAVEKMLKRKFVFNQFVTLYNEQATKSNIMDILLNKFSNISKNDAVFVFFSGHGGQEETDYGPLGFIVPYDGNFKDMRKVISMTTVKNDISKRIKAKHVFFVIDSCYSGLLLTKRGDQTQKTNRDVAYLKQIAKESVRQVLTAGSANQQVLDGGPNGHSVFAGRFLEILDSVDDFVTV